MLHYTTVNPFLKEILNQLMHAKEFEDFRLVGGTALSLQIGHRISVDIDLFTDIDYGKIDFGVIECYLESQFSYVDHFSAIQPGIGKSYLVGINKEDSIKLDIYYTDKFIQPFITIDSIRLSTIEEIIAMKMDVIQRVGRKKDFWDLHELLGKYGIEQMLNLHLQRYPYSHDRGLILNNLTNFSLADEDFEPICLKGKYWEFIKDDFEEIMENFPN